MTSIPNAAETNNSRKLTKMQVEKIEDALCKLAASGVMAGDIASTNKALIEAVGELNSNIYEVKNGGHLTEMVLPARYVELVRNKTMADATNPNVRLSLSVDAQLSQIEIYSAQSKTSLLLPIDDIDLLTRELQNLSQIESKHETIFLDPSL